MQFRNQVRGMWALSRHQWQVWAVAPFAFPSTLHCTLVTSSALPQLLLHRPGSTLRALSVVCGTAGRAAPSQRRDGGVVESSRNWPDRYCRPAKIITCWNGNPVCRAEMDQEMVAKDISTGISLKYYNIKYYNIRPKFVLNGNIYCLKED